MVVMLHIIYVKITNKILSKLIDFNIVFMLKYATYILLIEIFDTFMSNQLYVLYTNKTHMYILLNA